MRRALYLPGGRRRPAARRVLLRHHGGESGAAQSAGLPAGSAGSPARPDLRAGLGRHRQLAAGHGPWDRALYQGQLLPPAQQRQLEGLVSETTGRPIPATTPDPVGYGLGVQEVTTPSTGTVWNYEGETYGYRVLHLYFPRSGIIIAVAANSDVDQGNDDLFTLAVSVYQALQKAGTTRTGTTP